MTAIIQNRCSFRTELAECGNRHKKIGYLCFIIITLLTTLPMKRHHLLFLFAAFIAITSSAQKLDNLGTETEVGKPTVSSLRQSSTYTSFRVRRLLGLGKFGSERR